jgi:hypothetical protein
MKNKEQLIFSLFFISLLAAVPLVQLVNELSKKERIQAGDIFEDTFLTPGRRGGDLIAQCKLIADSVKVLQHHLKTGNNETDLYVLAEEILFGAKALREKTAVRNRYVTKETGQTIVFTDSLVASCEELLDMIDSDDIQAITAKVTDVEKRLSYCRAHFPSEGTLSVVRGIVHSFFNETFFSNRYLRAYEKELEERSLFVLSIRPVMQLLRYGLLGDLGVKAIGGKNGWLFYRPGIEYLYRPSVFDPRSKSVDYNDKALDDNPIEVITDFKKQLNDRGIDLIVVVVPGKGSIYPDLLNGDIRVTDKCAPLHSTDFLNRLNRLGVRTVDLFTPFMLERIHDTTCGDSLYLARDTHWRSRAVRLAAGIVADEVKKLQWYTEKHTENTYAVDTVEVERTGDVGVMTNLMNVSVRNLTLRFPTEMVKCFPVVHNYYNDSGTIIRQVPYHDDFRKSRILIIGDSFSRIYQTDAPRNAGWIAHLAYELSEPLASLVSDGGASTLVREKLARKAKVLNGKRLVIWEFVERDIRFGAFGWKKVTLP